MCCRREPVSLKYSWVMEQCREHALQVQEPYGVWGGLTINERAEILSTNHRAG